MTLARVLLLGALCAVVAVLAMRDARAQATTDELDRQVLVMLRMPAPHFRPDIGYTGSYDARAGREARYRIAEKLAREYDLALDIDWPMPALGVDCFVMHARDAASVPALVERLTADPRVESAQRMNRFNVLAHDDPLYALQPTAGQWHLAELHAAATGRGVRIAEIDTGVEADHPDLVGQIEAVRNVVDDRPDVAETHGTAVAGIMVARADNGIGIAGVAPGARLLALRACWERMSGDGAAVCSSFTLAKALQAALEARADVINLSVGGPRDALLARLVDVANARGIAVVAAVDPADASGGFPASHRGVLAIASADAHDPSATFLRAPGRDIPTTVVGRKWAFATGSSFAAAHVSGLVALLLEASPGAQPARLRDYLAAPRAMGAATEANPAIDACAALSRARGSCACECGAARPSQAALH
ncbi:MAG TPA: S8 family serine peptidase [Casimicrobiaceae bacterium]